MRKAGNVARAVAVAVVTTIAAGSAFAQEQQLVEEVVARVNAEVITRSQYLEAVQQTIDEIKQNTKDPQEAEKRIAEVRPKILDLMIDNILIVQKGADLNIEVDSKVNEQMVNLAKSNNMTVTQFEEELRKSGVNPDEARARIKENMMRDAVMNQEVYGSIYRALSEREKREFYEAHKEKFMQPGELKLSELFISVEGRSFSELDAKGKEIVTAARGGTAFADLVRKYGDPTRASYANKGSLGSFKSADDLAQPLAAAVKPLKAGETTEPIRLKEGIIILHVDEQHEAAPKPFEDVAQDVSLAMVYERSQDAEKKFLAKLRSEAYIKINPDYAPTPAPTTDSAKKADSK